MKLPKSWVTVTPFSKIFASILFILLPFVGFYLGIVYQKSLIVPETTRVSLPSAAPSITSEKISPLPINSRLDEFRKLPEGFDYSAWTDFRLSDLGFSIKLPKDWRIEEKDIQLETVKLTNTSLSIKKLLESKGNNPQWLSSSEGQSNLENNALGEIEISVQSKQPFGYNDKDGYEYYCLNKSENLYKGKTFCVTVIDPPLPSTGGYSPLIATYYFQSGSVYYSIKINSRPTIFLNDNNKQQTQDSETIKKAIVASFKFI